MLAVENVVLILYYWGTRCFTWILLFHQNVQHLGPATDFYKKLSLDCSAQQIAVDLFMMNSQYSDLASICKYFHMLLSYEW